MAKDSLPELELANVRTRERLTDSVAEIRRRSDVPARTRLAVAKARQRWHRDHPRSWRWASRPSPASRRSSSGRASAHRRRAPRPTAGVDGVHRPAAVRRPRRTGPGPGEGRTQSTEGPSEGGRGVARARPGAPEPREAAGRHLGRAASGDGEPEAGREAVEGGGEGPREDEGLSRWRAASTTMTATRRQERRQARAGRPPEAGQPDGPHEAVLHLHAQEDPPGVLERPVHRPGREPDVLHGARALPGPAGHRVHPRPRVEPEGHDRDPARRRAERRRRTGRRPAAEPDRGARPFAAAPITFIVGVLGALWSASGFVGAFGRAMNRIYNVREGRPIWKLRPTMLGVTLFTVVLLVVGLLVLVSGPLARTFGDVVGLGTRPRSWSRSCSGRSCSRS